MIKLYLLLIFLINLVNANYCLCENIIDEEVCSSVTTYEGICIWNNGKCSEMTCDQRTTLQQCEPEYGTFRCGWNGYMCLDPSKCSDISVKKSCIISGCTWVPTVNNETMLTLTTNGHCIGNLNEISCKNLNENQCLLQPFFFSYAVYSYEWCFLSQTGDCMGQISCPLYTSEVNCDQKQCKWDKTDSLCIVRQCGDLTTQQTCEDNNLLYKCRWENEICQPYDCDKILDKSHCNHENQGFGRFCSWNDFQSKCFEFNCYEQVDKSVCLSHGYLNGGVSSCSWIDILDGNGGQCQGCKNGPTVKFVWSRFLFPFGFLIHLLL